MLVRPPWARIIRGKMTPGTGPGPQVSLSFVVNADPTKEQACTQRGRRPCWSHGLTLLGFAPTFLCFSARPLFSSMFMANLRPRGFLGAEGSIDG